MLRARSLFALFVAVALLLLSVPINIGFTVTAQEATGIGAPVPVTNEEGAPAGSITVTEIADPFTDFNPDYPPEAGARYVALAVAFDADAGARFDIAPRTIVLQDDQGFLWNQASIVLPDDALVPELSSETLAPGSRVTGLVGFVVPEGSVPARVFYQPESSRLVHLADIIETEAPGIGEAVSVSDSEGGSGSVTVAEVTDPFEEFDPSVVPPEGTRFVLVTLVYENPGDGRFFVEPSGLVLRDADGNLWSATSVSRPQESVLIPDIRNQQLAPGDRLSGAAIFAVPEGTGLAGLHTSPVSGQLVLLADLQEGAASGTATPAGTPEAASDEATTTMAATACADIEQWLTTTRERIAQAGAMSVEDATLADPASMAEHAAEYVALADAQLAEQTPPEADAAGKALAATLNAYGGSIEQILGATEPGKDTVVELTEGMNTFNDAGERLRDVEDELARLAGACGLS